MSYVSCCCWSWFLSVCVCSLCAFSPIIFCLFAYVAQASFSLLLTHRSHVILLYTFTFIFTPSSLWISAGFLFFFPLTDSERAACNISGKYFSNNQTLVSICSVLLVVLQSLIWQHAALIWLSLHTTTKALNTRAPVSWTRNRVKPTKRDTGCFQQETWERQTESCIEKKAKRRTCRDRCVCRSVASLCVFDVIFH